MHSVQFLLIELFGGSISLYSHEAHRNYKLKVLFSNFVEAWLWIGCVPGIGPCSNPWACTVNWEGHADRDLFFQTLLFAKLLLFRSNPCLSSFPAIIRPHFLLIRLQQYAWNCDKQPLAPNLKSEKNTSVLQILASVHLYGFPCLRVTNFPSLCCALLFR